MHTIIDSQTPQEEKPLTPALGLPQMWLVKGEGWWLVEAALTFASLTLPPAAFSQFHPVCWGGLEGGSV